MDYYTLKKNLLISEVFVVIIKLVVLLLPENTLEIVKTIMDIASSVFLIISLTMYIIATTKNKVLTDEMVYENEAKGSQFAFLVLLSMLVVFLIVNMFFQIKVMLTSTLIICIIFFTLALKDGCYIYLERGAHKDANVNNED